MRSSSLSSRVRLDPVFTTRAALLDDDPIVYFDRLSTKKRHFHRALVQAAMVDLA
ncbi:hypothetical protein [Mesorhizobium sp. 128a]